MSSKSTVKEEKVIAKVVVLGAEFYVEQMREAGGGERLATFRELCLPYLTRNINAACSVSPTAARKMRDTLGITFGDVNVQVSLLSVTITTTKEVVVDVQKEEGVFANE
jgi:hypothetical protein